MDKVRQVKRREQPLLLTVDEAARLLGISRAKLYPLLSAGEVESIKLGGLRRVPRDAVDSYVCRLRGLEPVKPLRPPPPL